MRSRARELGACEPVKASVGNPIRLDATRWRRARWEAARQAHRTPMGAFLTMTNSASSHAGPVLRLMIMALALAASPTLHASADQRVEALLRGAEAPPGVVFEVVTGDEEALVSAIPRVRKLARRLRERFPGLDVAVVSHGREQFALLDTAASSYPDLHAQVQALTDQESIDVHVCGAHASWYDHVVEDFPTFVDVAPSAPARINDYRDLGYVVIEVD